MWAPATPDPHVIHPTAEPQLQRIRFRHERRYFVGGVCHSRVIRKLLHTKMQPDRLLLARCMRANQSSVAAAAVAPPLHPHHAHAERERERVQRVVVMRHGDRLDQAEPIWHANKPRPWDPPLTDAGLLRAWTVGKRIRAAAAAAGWAVHRVFVSPFLRCRQTAERAVAALCAAPDDAAIEDAASVPLDTSRLKVSIEYGLSEMMNAQAMGGIVGKVAPGVKNWFPDLPELEAVFPAGTIDRSAEPIYPEVPKWEESILEARSRYASVIQALADKYPNENLLLVTHGEGVGASVSYFEFEMGLEIYDVEYCAYSVLQRRVAMKPGDEQGSFKVLTKSGTTGIQYAPVN